MNDPLFMGILVILGIYFLANHWSDLTRLRKVEAELEMLKFQLEIHRKETFRRSEMVEWLDKKAENE